MGCKRVCSCFRGISIAKCYENATEMRRYADIELKRMLDGRYGWPRLCAAITKQRANQEADRSIPPNCREKLNDKRHR